MQTYQDGRLLFLSDAKFFEEMQEVKIPLIPGWEWNLFRDGSGFLQAPDGKKHCEFQIADSSIAFEPGGEIVTAFGLTLPLVQEMGERYANEVVFSDSEKKAYEEHVRVRDNTKRFANRKVYESLRGVIQIEYKNGSWLSHVDTEKVQELAGIDSPHVVSVEQGFALFNRMAETMHAPPLHDPAGYMALQGNLYEFIHTEYRNQYEDVLQAIDNQVVDGTGYGVEAVLNKLQATVRSNITKDVLPKGENFGNLRFMKATEETKAAVKDFVKCRVSKTLIYEKKRSYEKSAIEKANTKYLEAGAKLRDLLSGDSYSTAMEL